MKRAAGCWRTRGNKSLGVPERSVQRKDQQETKEVEAVQVIRNKQACKQAI